MAIKDRRIVTSLYLLVLALSLFLSFKIIVAMFGLDSDTAHAIMLWQGVESGGLSTIRSFAFTPDNWLLSIVPFNFLSFYLFGPKPELVILSGWLIFVLAAFVSGGIAHRLHARRAAFFIPIVLLLLGLYALNSGFAAYAVSHNITNLFGLTALLLLLQWLKTPKTLYLLALLALLTFGSLSDPWMLPAYDLPLFITSIVLLIWPGQGLRRLNVAKLVLVALATLYFIKHHLFGIFRFIPMQPVQRASEPVAMHNFLFLLKDTGGMLDIFPWENTNALWPSVLSLAAFAGLILLHLWIGYRHKTVTHRAFLVFLLFTLASAALISAAFVVVDIVTAVYSARFVLNILYFIVIGLAVLIDLNWAVLSRYSRAVSVLLAAFFVVSNLAGTYPLWSTKNMVFAENGAPDFIHFLQQNSLNYGYGPYWGSMANTVTALTDGAIRIRPVNFDPQTGMMQARWRAEAFRSWYTQKDFPPGQSKFFVVVTSDGEQCPDLGLCENGVKTQFGPPLETLHYANLEILVWPHPLLPAPLATK